MVGVMAEKLWRRHAGEDVLERKLWREGVGEEVIAMIEGAKQEKKTNGE